ARHLVPTHLDLDHAGGILDFPDAQVHTLEPEFHAAMNAKSFFKTQRYKSCQWTKETKWQIHRENYGEKWFGFDAVREIPGLPPEILIIPLFGHTAGHFGVAIQTKEGWILHAGDAFYDHRELELTGSPHFAWKLFQNAVHNDVRLALKNQKRLADLANSEQGNVKIICSHDTQEFHNCTQGHTCKTHPTTDSLSTFE
ncbi:MAG: hypothetical protein AAF202_11545, partial [Pseudomonadota bacterium]